MDILTTEKQGALAWVCVGHVPKKGAKFKRVTVYTERYDEEEDKLEVNIPIDIYVCGYDDTEYDPTKAARLFDTARSAEWDEYPYNGLPWWDEDGRPLWEKSPWWEIE